MLTALCWLPTDPTAALSISRDAQTAAGHKHSAASCSPGELHLVQTQGHSLDRMNPHLRVSTHAPLPQSAITPAVFQQNVLFQGIFFKCFCVSSPKSSGSSKFSPHRSSGPGFIRFMSKNILTLFQKNVRLPCSNKFYMGNSNIFFYCFGN